MKFCEGCLENELYLTLTTNNSDVVLSQFQAVWKIANIIALAALLCSYSIIVGN
jgi:hypothetical protein